MGKLFSIKTGIPLQRMYIMCIASKDAKMETNVKHKYQQSTSLLTHHAPHQTGHIRPVTAPPRSTMGEHVAVDMQLLVQIVVQRNYSTLSAKLPANSATAAEHSTNQTPSSMHQKNELEWILLHCFTFVCPSPQVRSCSMPRHAKVWTLNFSLSIFENTWTRP